MKSHGAEVSSLVKELQSSVGISTPSVPIPSVTSMMRNEFLPLMQSLEQSSEILSKTYALELALTLARFDALLKEEERRIFVCVFDSLSRHLLKDLHHFVEVEGLLQQDVLFLKELAERCRMIDHVCTCRTRNNNNSNNNNNNNNNNNSSIGNVSSSGALKENTRSTLIPSSSLPDTTSPRVVVDGKGQQTTQDVVDGVSVNCSFSELQQVFHGNVGNNQQFVQPIATPLMMTSGSGNVNTNANEVVSNQFNDSLTPANRMFQQQLPLGTIPSRNNNGKQTTSCRREDFLDFLMGRLSKSDITSLVDIVFPHDSSCEKNQTPVNSDEKVTSMGSTQTNNTSFLAENGKNNSNDNPVNQFGNNPQPMETVTPIHFSQKVDDSDCNTQVNDGFKTEEQQGRYSLSPSSTGSRTVNHTALYLNMLIETLVFPKSSAAPSLNSSFGSVEEVERNGSSVDVVTNVVDRWRGGNIQPSDLGGRLLEVPSKSALGLLSTVFPSLHNFTEEFRKFAEMVAEEGFYTSSFRGSGSGGVGGNSTVDSPRDNSRRMQGVFPRSKVSGNGLPLRDNYGDVPHLNITGALMADAGGSIRPADVVFYAFIRSIQELEKDSVVVITPRGEVQKRTKETISTEESTTLRTMTIPRQMVMQLELMIKQVQESIAGIQVMQEQIREEVTLLVFRVITTIVDFLIPAVYFVDRRVVLFYRKWMCDMYRLLWEEDLLDRFSALVMNSIPEVPHEISTTAISLPPNAPVNTPQTRTSATPPNTSITPTQGRVSVGSSSSGGSRRRSGGKSGSSVTVTKRTDTPTLPEKEKPKVEVEETTKEKEKEKENNMEVYISPGNAYSRASRNSGNGNDSQAFSNAASALVSSLFFSQVSVADVDPHSFGFFDDPAVLLAESLLEDTSTDTPPPRGVLITRLMAALLRGTNTDKLRRLASMQERTVRSRPRKERSPEMQPVVLRKTASTLRGRRQPLRKKNTPSPLKVTPAAPTPPPPLPPPIQPLVGTESKTEATAAAAAQQQQQQQQQQQLRLRYPIVTNVDEVKALYNSALSEAEILLSPLDPIRAALVQNTVDFLVSGLHNVTEAYEILDAYLDDVGGEPIQPLVTGRVALDSNSDHSRGGVDGSGSNNLHSAFNPLNPSDSPFSVISVRRAKAMPSDTIASSGTTGVRGHTSHGSHTMLSKRSAHVDKENSSAAVMVLPLIPKVIPSWNSKEESEQFFLILSLLRREYISLRNSLGVAALATKTEAKETSIK
ncbi:uncharacterized protein TM35_000034290 [Trypanosoma theileri]|uniref:Uncharacterized protein n=1 Tax=Trypanosoma theileri TaxID=67003 RepID=A0A1X0P6V8_9TRYP|nr:uncharacterized protein TM35_000034290 [Trypanosoma theileri]ORC92676.1 hypothetical protein TM35_000034290 [Trypanosoma theileri]